MHTEDILAVTQALSSCDDPHALRRPIEALEESLPDIPWAHLVTVDSIGTTYAEEFPRYDDDPAVFDDDDAALLADLLDDGWAP